jgi:hypothetical protein
MSAREQHSQLEAGHLARGGELLIELEQGIQRDRYCYSDHPAHRAGDGHQCSGNLPRISDMATPRSSCLRRSGGTSCIPGLFARDPLSAAGLTNGRTPHLAIRSGGAFFVF